MHHTRAQHCIRSRVQDGCCRVVNSLEAKAMPQTMLESRSKASLLHHFTCSAICAACGNSIADALQGRILCVHTGLVSFAPLVADCAHKEGAREFGPVAVDADLHLYRYCVSPRDG